MMVRYGYLCMILLSCVTISSEPQSPLLSIPQEIQVSVMQWVIVSRLRRAGDHEPGTLAIAAPISLVDLKTVNKAFKDTLESAMCDKNFKKELAQYVARALRSFTGETVPFIKGETKEIDWSPSDIDHLPSRFERVFFSPDETLLLFAHGLLGYKKALDAIAYNYVTHVKKLFDPMCKASMEELIREYAANDLGVETARHEQKRVIIPLYKEKPFDNDVSQFVNYSIRLFNTLDLIGYSCPWHHDWEKAKARMRRYDDYSKNEDFQIFHDTRLLLYLMLEEANRRYGYRHKHVYCGASPHFTYITALIKKLAEHKS